MFYFQISALFGGVVGLAVGIFVCIRGKRKPLNIIYSFLSIFSGIWSLGQFGYYVTKDKMLALVFCRLSDAVAILIPVFFLQFVFLLVNYTGKFRKQILLWSYILAGCFLVFSPTAFFINDVTPKMMFPWFPVSGGLVYTLFGVFFFIVLAVAFYALFASIKVVSSRAKIQLRYVAIASTLGFIGGGTSFPLVYDIKFPPYGFILFSCYPIIIAYAILKHNLMDIRLAVTKIGIFFVVYVLTLGFPFWIGYQTKSWLLATAFMALLATAGPIIHRGLQAKAEAVLLAKQKHYQRFLLQAARGMAREHKLQHLLNLIVHVIKRGVRPQFVAAFLFDEENKQYELKAIRGEDVYKTSIADCKLKDGDHLIESLEKNKRPISHDEIETYKSQMTNYKFNFLAHLVVPAFSDDHLLGFLVLGEKEDLSPYTEDDIDVFSIISQQAALAIDNCLFIEALKRNQQRLFEAEKLASIGGMAAGHVHRSTWF